MVKQESSSRAAVSEMDLYNWEVALTVELGGAVYAGAGGQGANIFNQYYSVVLRAETFAVALGNPSLFIV